MFHLAIYPLPNQRRFAQSSNPFFEPWLTMGIFLLYVIFTLTSAFITAYYIFGSLYTAAFHLDNALDPIISKLLQNISFMYWLTTFAYNVADFYNNFQIFAAIITLTTLPSATFWYYCRLNLWLLVYSSIIFIPALHSHLSYTYPEEISGTSLATEEACIFKVVPLLWSPLCRLLSLILAYLYQWYDSSGEEQGVPEVRRRHVIGVARWRTHRGFG